MSFHGARSRLVRVGVVASSGYIGGELLRLLLQHPQVDLTVATSRSYAGEYVFRVHPNLRGVTNLTSTESNQGTRTEKADIVSTALPHGESVRYTPQPSTTGPRIFDTSADLPLKGPSKHKTWHGF